MKKEYLVYAKRPMIYLSKVESSVEEWTGDKTKAKGFPTIKDARGAITKLMGTSLCKKEGDCVIVPIELKEKEDIMFNFLAKIIYSTNFWREELVCAPDVVGAFDRVFDLYMKHSRDVMGIEIMLKTKKIRTPEQHDNIRCERSL